MKKLLFLLFFTPLSIFAQHDQYHDCNHEGACTPVETLPLSVSTIRIFPNPVLNFFQISGLEKENTEGVLFDIAGRLIRRFNMKNGELIDISDLSASLYFLKIQTITLKIVKQ